MVVACVCALERGSFLLRRRLTGDEPEVVLGGVDRGAREAEPSQAGREPFGVDGHEDVAIMPSTDHVEVSGVDPHKVVMASPRIIVIDC